MVTVGETHLIAHQTEIDALELIELPDECPKKCPKCSSQSVRIVWNHRNTNSDMAYCSVCPERTTIGYVQKSWTGAPSKPRRRPDLHVSSDWVFERDRWTCQECGRNPQEDHVKLEVGHILSRKDGLDQGATDEEINHQDNLFASCHDCNNERGEISLPPLFVLRLIRARMRRPK